MKKKKGKRFLSILLSAILTITTVLPVFGADGPRASASGTEGIGTEDFLKADGKLIRNNSGTGEVVYLRGTNAGGYLLQEFWMCPTSYSNNVTAEMDIYRTLTSRFGESRMRELVGIYQDNYWTTADFDNCAQMGMNCIRLPFWYMNLVDFNGNLLSNAFDRLDWFVSEAGKRGIYVILDMHGAPGSQNGSDHSGVDGKDNKAGASEFFWGSNAASNQALYYDLWEKIAAHFKGNAAVAGYDLLNEPYCTYRYNSGYSDAILRTQLWNIYDQAYKRIRAVDPDHIIIMEATWNAEDLPNPIQFGWSNVCYEYHNYMYDDYDNANGTQISNMQSKINNINNANYNVPSYMGEFCYMNNYSAWSQGVKLLNDAGLNWTNWTYKVTASNGNWGLYHQNVSSVNVSSDSEADIRAKWSQVGSSTQNTSLVNAIKEYYPGTVEHVEYSNLAEGDYYITALANSSVVCAENYGNDPLAATSSSYTGDAERITVVNNSDGTISLKAGNNGNYVCAVIDENNQLLARSAAISTWEKFYLVKVTDTQYALKAVANGKYVKADLNDNGILKAASDSVAGAWEAFLITPVNKETPAPTLVPTETPDPNNFTVSLSAEKTNPNPNTKIKFTAAAKNEKGAVTYIYSVEDTTTGRVYRARSSKNCSTFLTIGANPTVIIVEAYDSEGNYAKDYIPVYPQGSETPIPTATPAPALDLIEPAAEFPAVSSSTTNVTLETGTGSGTKYPDFKVIGYVPGYRASAINSIDYSALTHCIISFFTYQNGSFGQSGWSAYDINRLVQKCHDNGVKVQIAVGGGGGFDTSSQPFSTAAKRTAFIDQVMNFVNTYNLDGVDIDIEVTDSNVWANFEAFSSELSSRLKANGKLLTMAVSSWFTDPIPSRAYNYYDWLNLMTYDEHFGDGDVASWNMIYNMISYYNNRGISNDRLTLGVPFYGYGAGGTGYTYSQIYDMNPSAVPNADYYNGIYYNGAATIKAKTEYSVQNMAGIMIWELGQDKFDNNSLLKVIKDGVSSAGGSTTVKASNVPGLVEVGNLASLNGAAIMTDAETGTTYVGDMGSGRQIDYYINAASDGIYDLSLPLAAGDAQWNAASITVKLDDSSVLELPVTGSTGWTTFLEHRGELNLTAGVHKLSLVTNGGACNIGSFAVTRPAIDIPGTVSAADTWNYTDGITFTTAGGVTYAGNMHDGYTISYKVSAAQSGIYKLKILQGVGGGQWDAESLTVTISGREAATLPIVQSGGWETFAENPFEAGLMAGEHLITIRVNGGAVNLAGIIAELEGTDPIVTPTPAVTPTPTATPAPTATPVPTSTPQYPAWDANKTNYVKGDIVTYNGSIYEAQWWTNSCPDTTDGSWKKIG